MSQRFEWELELLAVDENGTVYHIPVIATVFGELKQVGDNIHEAGDTDCSISKLAKQKRIIREADEELEQELRRKGKWA